jgi:hypothetical protein
MSGVEVGRYKGFGRTVVKGDVERVMICESRGGENEGGVCRELKEGELEDGGDDE